jgi:hypothetical protein
MAPHRGVLILVLGILGIVGVCPFLGPVAWIMGKADMDEIDSGRMDPEGRGMTQAGMVCGIISTVMMIVGLLLIAGFLALAIIANS